MKLKKCQVEKNTKEFSFHLKGRRFEKKNNPLIWRCNQLYLTVWLQALNQDLKARP